MFPEERRKKIVELVTKRKSILVTELSQIFDVSSETIRRDLNQLESKGKLKKGHGGAYVDDSVKNDIHVDIRESVYIKEKDSIGKLAAKLIKDGDVVLIDASTTSQHIIPYIKEKENITIITNSLKTSELVSQYQNLELILLGGRLDKTTCSLLGSETENMLSNYWIDKAFISCRGIDIENGITDGNIDQGIIRKKMLERAKTRILLVDQTKLNLTSFFSIDDFKNIDKLIINGEIEKDWKEFLKIKNIELIETK